MPDELAALGAQVHKISRAQFNAMVEAGVFEEESDHIELIDGLLVKKPRASPPHARAVRRTARALTFALAAEDVEIAPQNPFAAEEYYQPEPDVAVIPRSDDVSDHPSLAFLMVEVSRSRLRFDRITKQRLYARLGIAEYWIVNVVDTVVEVYRDPKPDGYASVETRRPGESVTLVSFPTVSVAVADLF